MRIEITSTAAAALENLRAFPAVLSRTLIRAMNDQNQIAEGVIRKNRLSGDGPFPPSQHKLGVVHSQLLRSLNSSKAVAVGDTVISSIGSNVIYAGIHEFGFKGTENVQPHIRFSHLRKVEGKKKRQRVTGGIVAAHVRRVNMPARAPIKHGLEDAQEAYGRGISDAIVAAMEKHL